MSLTASPTLVPGFSSCTAHPGLTLHFSARRKHCLWGKLGHFSDNNDSGRNEKWRKGQGLELVHFLARRTHSLWGTLGDFSDGNGSG